MKLMSERYQLPDDECKRIAGLLQSDINSKDEKIALSDKEEDEDEVEVIKKVQVLNNRDQEKDHVKYPGNDEELIKLSEALESFKASPWEEGIDWYKRNHKKCFGKTALNERGDLVLEKLKQLKKNISLKVCLILILLPYIISITF